MIDWLMDMSHWPPRWFCGQWSYWHGWVHIGSDIAIAAAYFTIPFVLLTILLRNNLQAILFNATAFSFALFIFCCGTTHFIDASLFWWPRYHLFTAAKLITAVVSWASVLLLLTNAPRALIWVIRVNRILKKRMDN